MSNAQPQYYVYENRSHVCNMPKFVLLSMLMIMWRVVPLWIIGQVLDLFIGGSHREIVFIGGLALGTFLCFHRGTLSPQRVILELKY